MKHLLLSALLITFFFQNAHAQRPLEIPNYKIEASKPGTNYYQLVADVRAKLKLKLDYLAARGTTEKNSNVLREEVAHFERWAYNLSFKVGPDGKIPNSAAGWINVSKSNPELLNKDLQGPLTYRTSASTWTSIGPFDSSLLNNWAHGAGIGRINVVRRHPVNKNVLFAGSASGGVFRSDNLGQTWAAKTDQLAGIGVSDIVIDPNNPLIMYMATGDFANSHIHSIGVYKSINGGETWTPTGLTFELKDELLIAHIYIDPENSNRIYATTTKAIYRSTDAGLNWSPVTVSTNPPADGEQFNDIIKLVSGTTRRVFVSSKTGKLYRSQNDGDGFDSVYHFKFKDENNNMVAGRLDFDYSPNKPDVLFLLGQANPAFSKYIISTNTVETFKEVSGDPAEDAKFDTQKGYNQVITVSPTNGDSIWVGEVNGKISINGGLNWRNNLNGYYDPNGASWGGFYVHSDYHHISYLGSDSLLIGNDGGVYVGRIADSTYKQRFNGLVTTQSYSMALFDAEPDNFVAGNQDNDGSSRVGVGSNAKYYGAQAGDGTATAIGRNSSNIRYLGGLSGKLGYSTDGYTSTYKSTTINTPAGAPGVWDLQMHNSNETILYGGFKDIHKMTGAPKTAVTDWVALNSGAQGNIQTIALANNDATTQKIIIIDSKNAVLKSANETAWSTITKPENVNFTSIYAKKTDWNILLATAAAYDLGNKVFYSTDNGQSWTNVTRNMPNIATKKVILYEGTDTVFVATELGIFFSRISTLTGPATGTEWARYGGTTLPNVRVDDMEISYAKKQLYAATFGRGIWYIDLSTSVLPLNNIYFTYTGAGGRYNLNWKIDLPELAKTTLERSTDARRFSSVADFSDGRKKQTDAWQVTLQDDVEYFRLKCTNNTGSLTYSNVIKLSNKESMLVNIYPNPVSGYMFVNSRKKIAAVTIYSVTGSQRAYARPGTNLYYFDMSLLPAGPYLVKVEDEKGNITTEKVMKLAK